MPAPTACPECREPLDDELGDCPSCGWPTPFDPEPTPSPDIGDSEGDVGELTQRIRNQQADTTEGEPSFTVTWEMGYKPTKEDDDALKAIVLAAYEQMKNPPSEGDGERWTLWRFTGECAEKYGSRWALALDKWQAEPHRPETHHGSETECIEVVRASSLHQLERQRDDLQAERDTWKEIGTNARAAMAGKVYERCAEQFIDGLDKGLGGPQILALALAANAETVADRDRQKGLHQAAQEAIDRAWAEVPFGSESPNDLTEEVAALVADRAELSSLTDSLRGAIEWCEARAKHSEDLRWMGAAHRAEAHAYRACAERLRRAQ